jgi:serine/tyrosine/threonine adenylyltransferase
MGLKVGHRFTQALVAELNVDNHPRQVEEAHYSWVRPEVFPESQLLHLNKGLCNELNLSTADNLGHLNDLLSNPSVLAESNPFAMCYGGHQFGHWAGQLGDGRAINLGNIKTANVDYELQLKGAGPTPYSRTADGYAVMRSSIREYLCSEAMFHLGIPTTRALALYATGKPVLRDMLYNGQSAYEPGAVVIRVARSFVRFGNFEILAARKDWTLLKQLLNDTISQFFPEISNLENKYIAFFDIVCESTLTMIVHWMRVGFVHGVMNTDNLSILGDTIDYGPYGWMDNFDLKFTPNTTDLPGRRYCFGHQPYIAQWNLLNLANVMGAVAPNQSSFLQDSLDRFATNYTIRYSEMMHDKLGLMTILDGDSVLIENLLDNLQKNQIDMTIFFRNLKHVSTRADLTQWIEPACYAGIVSDDLASWFDTFLQRLSTESTNHDERCLKMDQVNPKYVLRNYMAQLAIEAAHKGDMTLVDELYTLLQNPYSEQDEYAKWYALRPEWAVNKVGCSMLSCSS